MLSINRNPNTAIILRNSPGIYKSSFWAGKWNKFAKNDKLSQISLPTENVQPGIGNSQYLSTAKIFTAYWHLLHTLSWKTSLVFFSKFIFLCVFCFYTAFQNLSFLSDPSPIILSTLVSNQFIQSSPTDAWRLDWYNSSCWRWLRKPRRCCHFCWCWHWGERWQ